MKVLSVASEIYPLVKTGGLADVTGALPRALGNLGVETRTMVPGYQAVMERAGKGAKPFHRWKSLFGGEAAALSATVHGLDLLVLDAPHLFDRAGGIYGDASGVDWPDNWKRFAALSRAAADIALGAVSGYRPEIVHVHDWQAALTLAYLRYANTPSPPSVITIHNLAFQGRFPAEIFGKLGLPVSAMSIDGVEYFGGVGFLKAGLQAATAITTVSPTYAREIRMPEFGMGLEGLLNGRVGDLTGILNGIDIEAWDPANDQRLAATFSTRNLGARRRNADAVADRFGLDRDESPIVCVVSRLTWQKGMDILAAEIDRLVATGARLAILGSGDQAIEGALLAGASRHKGRAGVIIGHDETLARLLQGGADAILIPSRFEPCGLTQLYGLRYGCVPIVARTGGLADTIIDANAAALAAGVATGFQFTPGSGEAMVESVGRAVRTFAERQTWATIQRQGMKADFSWNASAGKYLDLYQALAMR